MSEGKHGAAAANAFFLLPDHAGLPFDEAAAALNRHLRPGSYLQIGAAGGGLLRLVDCPAITVQEQFTMAPDLLGNKPACFFMQMSSDRFFADYDPAALLNGPVDLAVLGGTRRFEALLRAFINAERCCWRESIIVLPDCLPTDAHAARREASDGRFERQSPHPRCWTGDLWKVVAILKRYRPELRVLAFDAKPAGLVAVTDLDPGSDVLEKQYFALADQFRSGYLTQAGAEGFMRVLNVTGTAVLEDAAALAALVGHRIGVPSAPAPNHTGSTGAQAERYESLDGPITLHALRQINGPVPGVADIWDRLHALLLHWRLFNADEAKRAQQHGMIRDGGFLMPSPFGEQPDLCTESYYVPHRFCYRFRSPEDYFWISAPLDDAFALSTIFFPKRRIAVCLVDCGTGEKDLLELERMRSDAAKPAAAAGSGQGKRVVVTGHSHYMHTLWNELPALERAAAAGLADSISVIAAYQPLGPLAELFPEFAPDLRKLSFDEVSALNCEHRMPIGLGSRTITRGVQERVRAVAARHAGTAARERRDRLCAAHSPIFWLSVKPLGRTCVRQAEVLAHLIAAAKQAYPSAGFILNGTSRPWDVERNGNYGSWFANGLRPASEHSQQTIAEVIARLPQAMRSCVQSVSDVSVCEEIVWGAAAHFYFCHGGTMQNKIGWIHRIPGMVHSSREFMEVWKSNAQVVEDAPPCYFVSSDIIVDSDPESYAAFTRQRTVANYEFTSLDELARQFLDAAGESLAAPDRHSQIRREKPAPRIG